MTELNALSQLMSLFGTLGSNTASPFPGMGASTGKGQAEAGFGDASFQSALKQLADFGEGTGTGEDLDLVDTLESLSDKIDPDALPALNNLISALEQGEASVGGLPSMSAGDLSLVDFGTLGEAFNDLLANNGLNPAANVTSDVPASSTEKADDIIAKAFPELAASNGSLNPLERQLTKAHTALETAGPVNIEAEAGQDALKPTPIVPGADSDNENKSKDADDSYFGASKGHKAVTPAETELAANNLEAGNSAETVDNPSNSANSNAAGENANASKLASGMTGAEPQGGVNHEAIVESDADDKKSAFSTSDKHKATAETGNAPTNSSQSSGQDGSGGAYGQQQNQQGGDGQQNQNKGASNNAQQFKPDGPAEQANETAHERVAERGTPAPKANEAALQRSPSENAEPKWALTPERLAGWSDSDRLDMFASGFSHLKSESSPLHSSVFGGKPSPAQMAQAARQFDLAVTRAVENGDTNFTINLNPEELGRVTVRLNFTDGKKVTAEVIAQNPETLEMLQKDTKNLERALEAGGHKLDSSDLSFSLDKGNEESSGKAFALAMQQEKMRDELAARSGINADQSGNGSGELGSEAEEETVNLDEILPYVTAETGLDIRV